MADGGIGEAMLNGPDDVIECHPTPVLAATPHDPTDAHAERSQHRFQATTVRTEDDANSQVDHPNPVLASRFARGFPVANEVRQEARPTRSRFSQNFLTTVPVKADRRSTDQRLRRSLELTQGFTEELRRLNATPSQPLLDSDIPTFRSNIFASEMNNGQPMMPPHRPNRAAPRP